MKPQHISTFSFLWISVLSVRKKFASTSLLLQCPHFICIFEIEQFLNGAQWTTKPERAAKTVRPRSRSRHFEPFFVDPMRAFGIHENIAVLVTRLRLFDPHSLVPAVHAADRVRMNGVGDVLVNAAVRPKDAAAVLVFAFEGFDAGDRLHFPAAFAIVFDV